MPKCYSILNKMYHHLDNLESNSYENEIKMEQLSISLKQEEKLQKLLKNQETKLESDPFSRFRDLSLDQIKIRMRQLEYDKKRLGLSTKSSNLQAAQLDEKVQKLRDKITSKTEDIANNEIFIKRLEDLLESAKKSIDGFIDFQNRIQQAFDSRVNVPGDSQESESEDYNKIQINPISEYYDESIFFQNSKQESRESKKRKISSTEILKQKKLFKNEDFSCSDLESPKEDIEKECPYNKGPWSTYERGQYQKFVYDNRDILAVPEMCYKVRIFRQMSNSLGTRSAKQCRTFHRQVNKKKKE